MGDYENTRLRDRLEESERFRKAWAYEAKRYRDSYGEAKTEIKQLREALEGIDPNQLELLAAWIDAKYPNDDAPEVQQSLRRWASLIRAALDREGGK
jgi:phytoene/squalene synthetase